MTEAYPSNYWLSPTALYITLNALGEPNYIQANTTNGTQILVYVKGIIGYDDGHNYRRWNLTAGPTLFNTSTLKYVYAAIPRDTNDSQAFICYPSEKVDLYGKNEDEEQIGDTAYYYVFLQGIISAPDSDGERNWDAQINCGTLSSDEALTSVQSEWFTYDAVSQMVTFIKTVLSATINYLTIGSQLIFGTKKVTDIADGTDLTDDSSEHIATPAFVKAFGNTHYLRKDVDTTAEGVLTLMKGTKFGTYSPSVSGGYIDQNGDGELKSLTLRESLTVPKLVYNRTEVQAGNTWRCAGGGEISTVTQQGSTVGAATLKLEDGEIGMVAVGDICQGIFHMSTGNDTASSDAKNGDFHFAGFKTIYFEITAVSGEHNESIQFKLRSATDSTWTDNTFPQPHMNFACYGNRTNADRQSSALDTTTYHLLLSGVTSWNYTSDNIQYIEGYLHGFTIKTTGNDTVNLEGYGLAFGRAYMWGNIQQFDRDKTLVSQQLYRHASTDTSAPTAASVKAGSQDEQPTAATPYLWAVWEYTFDDSSTSLSDVFLASNYSENGVDGSQPNLFGYDSVIASQNAITMIVHTNTGIAAYVSMNSSTSYHWAVAVKNILTSGQKYAVSCMVKSPVSGTLIVWLNGTSIVRQSITANTPLSVKGKGVAGTDEAFVRIQVNPSSTSYSGLIEISNLKIENAEELNGTSTLFNGLASDNIPQGQNLLSGAKDMTDFSAPNTSADGYQGCAMAYSASSADEYTTIIQRKNLALKANTWYTFSWWAKASSDGVSIGSQVYVSDYADYAKVIICDGDGVTLTAAGSYPQNRHTLSTDWKLHTFTFKTRAAQTAAYIRLFNTQTAGNTVYVSMPKLEEGEKATAWQQSEDDRQGTAGARGAMLRPCGEWSSSATYVNNSSFVDAVVYNNLYYSVKDGVTTTTKGTFVSSEWEAANQMKFVATQLLLAQRAAIDNLLLNYAIACPLKSDGSWDADNLTMSIDGTTGMLRFFGKNKTQPNIRFGVNENGMSVLEYYDDSGNKLYDLGPDGITSNIDRTESRMMALYGILASASDSGFAPSGTLGSTLTARTAPMGSPFCYQYKEGSVTIQNVTRFAEGGTTASDDNNMYYTSNEMTAGSVSSLMVPKSGNNQFSSDEWYVISFQTDTNYNDGRGYFILYVVQGSVAYRAKVYAMPSNSDSSYLYLADNSYNILGQSMNLDTYISTYNTEF